MRSSLLSLLVLASCNASTVADVPPARSPSPLLRPRLECQEAPRACRGFVDTNPDDPALGAREGAAAADALFCAEVLKGHAERCPVNVDSRTQQHLCPESTRGPVFAGEQVMCGACRSTRAEMLAFGIKALVDAASLDDLKSCASAGRCEAWRGCEEARLGKLRAGDWTADFLGWALAPGRELMALGEAKACRPHDAATWIEAVTFFARLSGLTAHLRCSSLDVSEATRQVAARLKDGCRLRNVEHGDQAWIAGAVALNNAGIYCMAELPGGARSADICGADDIETCGPTRYVMATVVARMRGDIELAACAPIDIREVECTP
jgi:hypothetical protein